MNTQAIDYKDTIHIYLKGFSSSEYPGEGYYEFKVSDTLRIRVNYDNVDISPLPDFSRRFRDMHETPKNKVLSTVMLKLNHCFTAARLDEYTVFVEYERTGYYRHPDYPSALLRAEPDTLPDIYKGALGIDQYRNQCSLAENQPGETLMDKVDSLYSAILDHHNTWFCGPVTIKFKAPPKQCIADINPNNIHDDNIESFSVDGFSALTESIDERIRAEWDETDETGIPPMYPTRDTEKIILDYVTSHSVMITTTVHQEGSLEYRIWAYDGHVNDLLELLELY